MESARATQLLVTKKVKLEVIYLYIGCPSELAVHVQEWPPCDLRAGVQGLETLIGDCLN